MEVPLQIVFRNMNHSDAIASKIRERAKWLEGFCERIISCRVAVEAPHRHHRHGNLYRVRIDLRVPGEELVVSRNPELNGAYRDLQVVVHHTFEEARRQLEDYVRRRRREVKRDETPAHGIITKLVWGEGGFGFLRALDGHEVYFNNTSIINTKFDDLEIGTEVRFSEEMGEDGPQASSLEVVGKQGRQFNHLRLKRG